MHLLEYILNEEKEKLEKLISQERIELNKGQILEQSRKVDRLIAIYQTHFNCNTNS